MAAGETKVESFTISVDDQHGGVATKQIDVTAIGTNDVPVITSAPVTGSVTEDAANTTLTGTATATDVDHGATQTWQVLNGAGTTAGTAGHAADFSFAVDELKIKFGANTVFDDTFSGTSTVSAPNFNGAAVSYSVNALTYSAAGSDHLSR